MNKLGILRVRRIPKPLAVDHRRVEQSAFEQNYGLAEGLITTAPDTHRDLAS